MMPRSTLLLCVLLLACAQPQKKSTLREPSFLYGYWVHSVEEDDFSLRTQVYRPETYALPPSRGRDGFEIKEDGILIAHPIAPSEGSSSFRGKWRLDGDELTFFTDSDTSRFKIVSLTRDKLVLTK